MVWHLYNGYSVHTFPRFCWFRDYSNSILIKLLFNLGLLSRLFSFKCGELFWKVGCYLCWKGFLLTSLPGEIVRGGFSRWSSTGSDICHPNLKRTPWENVAEDCPVMPARETPCLGYLLFITNFSPSYYTGFPLFPLRKLVIMSFPIHIHSLIR